MHAHGQKNWKMFFIIMLCMVKRLTEENKLRAYTCRFTEILLVCRLPCMHGQMLAKNLF